MSADHSLEDHLLELELQLLQPEVRRSTEEASRLLADDFREFGSSGRAYDKRQIIEALCDEPACNFTLHDFCSTALSGEAALVTYRTTCTTVSTGEISHALRSSIWVLRDGRWQMLFHQGTRIVTS
jgi:hypothetical protein